MEWEGGLAAVKGGTTGKADAAVMSINTINQREHLGSVDNATLKNDPCGLVASLAELHEISNFLLFPFTRSSALCQLLFQRFFHPLSVLDTASHSDCIIGFPFVLSLSPRASQLG